MEAIQKLRRGVTTHNEQMTDLHWEENAQRHTNSNNDAVKTTTTTNKPQSHEQVLIKMVSKWKWSSKTSAVT